MKKILIFTALVGIGLASCRKTVGDPSKTITVSYPTITVVGATYYSIKVGGALPTITATAYDSFYRQSYPVTLDLSSLDNTTPGLYAVTATSIGKYTYTTYKTIYVGVTNMPAAFDITGTYIRTVAPPNSNRVTHITKVANGMFLTDNVGGVDITDPTSGPIVPAVFIFTDSATFDFGTQVTNQGTTLSANTETVDLTSPVTLNYALDNSSFGTQVRTFVMQ